jgi:hypothetical protein
LLLLLGAVCALASPARAITLKIGGVEFWIEDRDNGTEYNIPGAVGTSIGVPNNPAAGIPAMDAAGGILPAGGMSGANWWPGVSVGTSEDSWGIARTDLIKDVYGNVLWNATTANTELTWFFYGAEDFYAENQDGVGLDVLTASVHLRAQLWEDPLATGTPLPLGQGSLNRPNLTTYTGVTDATATMLLQLDSVPGFIRTAPGGVPIKGGPATEFETQFNALSFTGQGLAYFDVTGGTMATNFDLGTIWTPASLTNGVPNCDAWAKFDAYPALDGPNPSGGPNIGPPYDWLVKTGGQVYTSYVPEPVTMASLLLGVGCLGGYVRKRKR